jgi:hypothetical protein
VQKRGRELKDLHGSGAVDRNFLLQFRKKAVGIEVCGEIVQEGTFSNLGLAAKGLAK